MSNTEVIVSKEQFHDFQRLQEDGSYNMIDPAIRDVLDLSKEEHYYILSNYEKLLDMYGSVID